MMRNVLDQETSPYLRQHRDNPVHWQVWNPETLKLAAALDRPILLSIGYAACHWCHVMAHESFEDPAIAALINRLFVPVKVDREERPDLDAAYQAALAMMGQQGGWPLTLFLTPEGRPIWGGTYFPPQARYGRPGFAQALEAVDGAWRGERERLAPSITALAQRLEDLNTTRPGVLSPKAEEAALASLKASLDPIHGGLGTAPKFPQAPQLSLLWRAGLGHGDQAAEQGVIQALEAMALGGIYDHLGGGFARYSTDERWLAPHFEKMLYDNALLIELLTEGWARTGRSLLADRIRATIAWLQDDMRLEGGAFAASRDADSEGEEGRYYVWREDEIDAVLGDDSPAFKQAYDVTPGGNWEGKTILNRLHADPARAVAEEAAMASARARLLAQRQTRIPPGRDDKILTDWNGLTIAALALAGLTLGERDWLATARQAYAFLRGCSGQEGRLVHSWCAGRVHPALLDDYAAMIRAALILFEAEGDPATLDQARAWVALLDRDFWNQEAGAYALTPHEAPDVPYPLVSAHDGPTPSGNGLMVENLARLYYLTGQDSYRQRAETVLGAFAEAASRHGAAFASLLVGAAFLRRAVQVVLVGPDDDPAWAALHRAAFSLALPNRLVHPILSHRLVDASHPGAGKTPVDGRPTAYVCVGPTCAPPVTDPDSLIRLLSQANDRTS